MVSGLLQRGSHKAWVGRASIRRQSSAMRLKDNTGIRDDHDDLQTSVLSTNKPPHEHDAVAPFIINGEVGNQRYDELLDSVGLGDLKFAGQLPVKRTVSPNDIFCNRELKLANIRAVGFDMDYTLAQYQQPAFDKLSFDGAKQKLVQNLGYPEPVLDFVYDPSLWTRGLIIDTQRYVCSLYRVPVVFASDARFRNVQG
jgi:5' nucleotidase family